MQSVRTLSDTLYLNQARTFSEAPVQSFVPPPVEVLSTVSPRVSGEDVAGTGLRTFTEDVSRTPTEDVASRTATEDVASRTPTEDAVEARTLTAEISPAEALLQQARSLTEILTKEEEEPCQPSLNSPVHLTRTVSGTLPSSR